MMKLLPLTLGIAAVLFIHIASAEITSDKALLDAMRTIMTEKSETKLDALTYKEGMSDADKQMFARMRKYIFQDGEIETITLEPLPDRMRGPAIMNGKKLEPTCEPVGLIKIKYKTTKDGDGMSTSAAYGKVGDAYWLIGTKATDLHWKGPPDKPIGYMIMGAGQNKISVSIKYNVSGVDLEQKDTSASMSFYGQYISSVTIKSSDPDADLTLTLRDNGEEIAQAGPYKGVGEWTYERKKTP
ncbi:MAG: hypothetical protein ACREKL_00430 [Chthoniobacterales bacterium]